MPTPGQASQIPPELIHALTVPKWKFTEQLPKLNKTNFIQWRSNLLDIIREHDFENITDPSFSPPTFNPQRATYEKAISSCRRMITASFSEQITHLIPATTYTANPADILLTLSELLHRTSAADHSILEKEAKKIRLTPGSDISEYIEQHLAQRACMISAEYPHIHDETTTVKFIPEGLRNNPQFEDIIRYIKSTGIPTSINDIHGRLHDIQEENERSDPTRPTLQQTNRFTSSPHRGGYGG